MQCWDILHMTSDLLILTPDEVEINLYPFLLDIIIYKHTLKQNVSFQISSQVMK